MPSWSKKELTNVINKSLTISQVLRQFGLDVSSGNYKTFHKYVNMWGIDTSHFVGNKLPNKFYARQVKPLSEILVENSWDSRTTIRRRIISEKLLEERCSICGITDWNDKEISFHLDHINGIPNDNRISNLRFLCPNCHSQTNTYGSRKNKSLKTCPVCDGKMSNQSKHCRKCAAKVRSNPTKINWPSTDDLLEMLRSSSYLAVGKRLGVSDNAIRKRIKKYRKVV